MIDHADRSDEERLRRELVELGRRLDARGLVAGVAGNLSVGLGADRLLMTPSGVAKGRLEPDELIVVDRQGRVVAGSGRPTSELRLHLEAFRVRPELGAVVHAHPRAVVAHTLAGRSLAPAFLPESLLICGRVAEVGYSAPGSEALAEAVGSALAGHDAVILERHGTVTVGADLEQAFVRLDTLEHVAETVLLARLLGGIEPLAEAEVERLLAAAPGLEPRSAGGGGEELVDELVRRVLARLEREG